MFFFFIRTSALHCLVSRSLAQLVPHSGSQPCSYIPAGRLSGLEWIPQQTQEVTQACWCGSGCLCYDESCLPKRSGGEGCIYFKRGKNRKFISFFFFKLFPCNCKKNIYDRARLLNIFCGCLYFAPVNHPDSNQCTL